MPLPRQTTMNKHVVPLLVGSTVLVAGCGTGGDVAGPTPRDTADPGSTAVPSQAYDVDDYTFTLRTLCFCVDGGVPVVVTVRDGKVADAVYARNGMGHAAGDRVRYWRPVTIDDVIDLANTKHAAQVRVRWPTGQDYPTSVWVDRDENTADEEIGYTIHDVIPE